MIGQNDLLDELSALWDWRRQVADLYRGIRDATDPAAAWRHWCATRGRLFRGHRQSPIEPDERAGYGGPFTFPYDPALRFCIRLGPTEPAEYSLDTGADGRTTMRAFARTIGLQPHLGAELTVWWIALYGGGVFLPFADATNGAQSYGGGRYLLDTIKGADLGAGPETGSVVLDFNFAYFPSCAYSPRYVCPLAPADNRLPAPVRAGERLAP